MGSWQPVGTAGVIGRNCGAWSVACPGSGAPHSEGESQSSSGLSRAGTTDEHHRHGQAVCGGCAQWNRKELKAGWRASASGQCGRGRDKEMEVRTRRRRKYWNRGVQVPAPGLKGIGSGYTAFPRGRGGKKRNLAEE